MNNDLKNIDVSNAKKHSTLSAGIIYLILMFVKNITIVLVFIIWMEHFHVNVTLPAQLVPFVIHWVENVLANQM
jgi:hypothetical protein